MAIKWLVAIAFALAIAACSGGQKVDDDNKQIEDEGETTDAGKTITLADADKTITVSKGSSIDVELDGNPTTGYQWKVVSIEGDAVQATGEDFEAPEQSEDRVGAGGTYIFHFKAVAKGKAVLNLAYARDWEKTEYDTAFSVTLNVD